ncbi:UDP-N-acetylmuramate dehydrogenase [Oryzomonas sagensis]|uniref:UDP-N-acetylenolpyruvoylglucosamine reductase n=1 Tax=Oryzomonas sagensis TaxID=2603857 RepID=A0ABQ6TR07_9BACT|nr:UDP-N-acetylmuramate dehydrogenase [Oryzomonas sagensis]KAB0671282.1 UDP-N-acetylmuramate dehydrogenase [Oryzomonas sagensis]
MNLENISIRGQLLYDEPMSRHTSLKVGGAADLYAEPEDADDLLTLVRSLKERQAPWLTIGRGYNLLVRDGGIRGAVISLARFNRISEAGERLIRAEAGVENLALVRFAQERGLGGIGYISGIPGTVGGAVKMNAGAYGSGVLERLESLTLLLGDTVAEYRREELDYGYRRLTLPVGAIVLAALFRLVEYDPQQTEEEIRKDTELRRSKHNVGFPSAGSFFKNPSGQAAWRLIDRANLRGVTVGGAQVSKVHSNFLINRGGATAADFLGLATRVKEAVFAATGVQLEEEVRIVGEEP